MSSFVPLDISTSGSTKKKEASSSQEAVPLLLGEKPEIELHEWPENPVQGKRQTPLRHRQHPRERTSQPSGAGLDATLHGGADDEPSDPVARRTLRKQRREEAKQVADMERAKRVETRRARAAKRDGVTEEDEAQAQAEDTAQGSDNPLVSGEESGIPNLTESELLALVEEARSQGRQEVEQAVAEERAVLQAQAVQLQQTLEAVEAMAQTWTQTVGSECSQVVLTAVDHVVGQTPELLSAMLDQRIRMIVERMAQENELVLRVAPDQVEQARELLGERPGWKVIADDDIQGGVIAEAAGGRLRATLTEVVEGLNEVIEVWRQETLAPTGVVSASQAFTDDEPEGDTG
jgi:flagellar biosynthesis/type III secretory pathway protein FliH